MEAMPPLQQQQMAGQQGSMTATGSSWAMVSAPMPMQQDHQARQRPRCTTWCLLAQKVAAQHHQKALQRGVCPCTGLMGPCPNLPVAAAWQAGFRHCLSRLSCLPPCCSRVGYLAAHLAALRQHRDSFQVHTWLLQPHWMQCMPA